MQPLYTLFIIAIGPAIDFALWLMLNRTGSGRMVRAAQMDRVMLDALGANVGLIIVQAFIIVVIGGMGSLWGTFWGSVVHGQVHSFGILIFPGFSLFSVFALMAVILIVQLQGLFVRPL